MLAALFCRYRSYARRRYEQRRTYTRRPWHLELRTTCTRDHSGAFWCKRWVVRYRLIGVRFGCGQNATRLHAHRFVDLRTLGFDLRLGAVSFASGQTYGHHLRRRLPFKGTGGDRTVKRACVALRPACSPVFISEQRS